ncbi:MAG: MFS transporter, partial [Micrococcales bacterium]
FSYLNISPFIYGQVYAIPANLVGIYFAANSALAYIGSQIGARLSNRFQPQWVLLGCLIVCLLAGVVMTVGELNLGSIWIFQSMLMLFTFGFGATVTPVFALAMAAHPNEAGTAAGVLGVAGFVFTTALAGVYLLLDHTSGAGVGTGMAVSMTIGILILFAVVRPSKLAKLT